MIQKLKEKIGRLAAGSLRWVALAVAIGLAGSAKAGLPTITVSGNDVTISTDSGQHGNIATNNGGSDTLTIPAATDLASGTILRIKSIPFGTRTGDWQEWQKPPASITLAGVSSAAAEVTTSGYTDRDKYTYAFTTPCLMKVGTGSAISFRNSAGEQANVGLAASLYGSTAPDAYLFSTLQYNSYYSHWNVLTDIEAEIVTGYVGSTSSSGQSDWGFQTGSGSGKVYLSGYGNYMKTDDQSGYANDKEIVLVNGAYDYAFNVVNGNSFRWNAKRYSVWKKISGDGTFTANATGSGITPAIKIYDVSEFAGTINACTSSSSIQLFVIFCGAEESIDNDSLYDKLYENYKGSFYVSPARTSANGNVVTVPAGKTWKANKFLNEGETVIDGTFDGAVVNNGTLTINGMVTGQITNNGTIKYADTSITSLTLGNTEGEGTIDLSALTALESVTFNVTTARSVGTIVWPTGFSGTVSVIICDDSETTGTIAFDTTGLPDNTTYRFQHADGVEIKHTLSVNGVTRTYTYTPTTGKSCWMDYEFEGDLGNAGTDTTELNYDSKTGTQTMHTAADSFSGGKLLTYTHPWRNINSYPETWSAVIRANVFAGDNAPLLMFGSTTSGTKGLIGLVTVPGEADEVTSEKTYNKVALATWKDGTTGYTTNSLMTVANATTAQHVYAFTKSVADGTTTINVYCDGELITKYTTTDTVVFGTGLQFGGSHGGGDPVTTGFVRFSDDGDSKIDFVRLYQKDLSVAENSAILSQIVKEYPYISEVGLYERNLDGTAVDWKLSNAWTKSGDSLTAETPPANAMVKLTASGNTEVTLKNDTAYAYERLTFDGVGAITLKQGAYTASEAEHATRKISAASVVVNTDTTVEYGAVDFSGSRISVQSGKTLTFDLSSGYDFTSINRTTTFQLTGYVAAYEPGAVAITGAPNELYTLSVAYNSLKSYYEATITPATATLTHAGASQNYDSVSGALADAAADDTITVNITETADTLTIGEAVMLVLNANVTVGTLNVSTNLTVTGAGTLSASAVAVSGDATITGYDLANATVTVTSGSLIAVPAAFYTLGTDTQLDAGYTSNDGSVKFIKPVASVTTSGGTSYYSEVTSAFSAVVTAISTDENASMTLMNGASASSIENFFSVVNVYYNSASGTITKAVAKVGSVTYGSLASAISDGATITLLRSAASEHITLNVDVTLTEQVEFAGTLSGSGTLTLTKLRTAAMNFGEWTGTVVLPANQAFGGQKFDDYGIAGSTVRLQGANTGWFYYGAANNTPNRAPVATTIEIPEGASLTVTGWSSSFANALNVLKGSGTFAVNIESDIDITDSSYSAYFLLKDVSDFTGSLSASGAGIAIGQEKPVYYRAGGYIILRASATAHNDWTAANGVFLNDGNAVLTVKDGVDVGEPGTMLANCYVKREAGSGEMQYSVDIYNTVTIAETANVTVTASKTTQIVDGETVTLTITPATGYYVTGVVVDGVTAPTSATSYDITVNADTTVSATVALYTYTVTWIVDETTDTTTVDYGANPTYADPVKQYYTFTGWNDGSTQYAAGDVLPAVYGNGVTYTATFSRNTVTVTVPTVENATVSVQYTTGGVSSTGTEAGTYTVDAGTSVTVTYTTAEGYYFGGSTTKEFNYNTVTESPSISVDPALHIYLDQTSVEMNYNGTVSISVVGAPEGATYSWSCEKEIDFFSVDDKDTATVAIIALNTSDTYTFNVYVTIGTDVVQLSSTVTVVDLAAVVGETEYTAENIAVAVADAISTGEVLELYYDEYYETVSLTADQVLRVKAMGGALFSATVTGPENTVDTCYAINTYEADGVVTYSVGEVETVVEYNDGNTVKYFAELPMSGPAYALRDGAYTLLKNLSVGSTQVQVWGTTTLDLNGKTISSTYSGTDGAIKVRARKSLTVCDSVGGGIINTTGSFAIEVAQGSKTGGNTTLTITGGSFVSNNLDIDDALQYTSVTLTGGSFSHLNKSQIEDYHYVPAGYVAVKDMPEEGWYTVLDVVTLTLPAYDSTKVQPAVTASAGNVTDNGDGTYLVQAGSTVTITWTAVGANIVTSEAQVIENVTSNVSADSVTAPTVVPAVAVVGGAYYATLQAALDAVKVANTVTPVVDLVGNATLEILKDGNVLGGSAATSITINGNGNTLTFVKSETWAQVNTANNAELVLNNVALVAQNSANFAKSGYSNDLENPNHNIAFNCPVTLNDATSGTALSFFKDAALDTVTVAETVDVYSIWIHTSASTVDIENLVVNTTTGRGIKVDDSFVSAWGGTASATAITIDGATFTTKNKKAAVLVRSNYATTVAASGTIDISGVPADTTNLVWVDEASAASYNLVTVTGATKDVESANYVATVSVNNAITGYFKTLADAFNAAPAGATVTVIADNTMASTIQIYRNVTLDLNGKTVTGPSDGTVFIPEADIAFTITDTSDLQNGKVYSATSKIVLAGNRLCTFTLEAGTLESGNVPVYLWGAEKTGYRVVINGGTVKSTTSTYSDCAIYAMYGSITFNDGVLDAQVCNGFHSQTIRVNGGTVKVRQNGKLSGLNNSDFQISGGTFYNVEPAENNIVSGKIAVETSTGVWEIRNGSWAAEVDGKKYETFAEAWDAISNATGAVTLKLRANATLDLSRNGNALGGDNVTKITIDGNNKTLTFVRSETWAQVNTANNATLVLKNVNLAAENSANYNKTQYSNLLENPNHNIAFNCPVELNNVTSGTALSFFKDAALDTVTVAETVDVYSIWIHTSASTVDIENLVVNTTTGRGIKVDDSFVAGWGGTPSATSISIDGATFTTKNRKAAVLVRSICATTVAATGTIDITGVPADTTNLVWVDEASATKFDLVTVTGATVAIEPGNYVAAVSAGNTVKAYYTTLQAAVNAAVANDTVTLLANVAEAVVINSTAKITLDGQNQYGIIPTSSTHSALKITASNADVELKNITVGDKTYTGRAVNIYNAANVKLVVTNSRLYSTIYTLNVYAEGAGSVDNVDITVTDTEIEGWAALNLWGDGGKVVVTGGKLTGNNKASYSPGNNEFGVIVLEGLSSGTTGATNYDISVTGTALKTTSVANAQNKRNVQAVVLYNPHSDGSTVKLTNCTVERGEGDASDYPLIFEDTGSGVNNALLTKGVTDYGTSTAAALPAGYAYSAPDADGYSQVVAAVAEVNGTGYATLAEAIAQTTSGTITLLKDCEGDGIFVVENAGKNITIDFGGYTYTVVLPVGSSTTVNQMLHFEADNTITLTNGKIKVTDDSEKLAAFQMVMQNYCNLTIDGMEIDGTGIAIAKYGTFSGKWAVFNNTDKPQFNYNGSDVSKIRNSTIIVPGDISIDEEAGLAISGNTVINAKGIATKGTDERFASVNPVVEISGGTFSFPVPAVCCAAGYEPKDNGDGTYGVQTAKVEVETDEDDPTPTAAEPVTVLVAVPKACTAATLVDVENRAEGDILKAYVKADDCFYTWELDSNKVWQPKSTYKVDESGASESNKSAEEVNLTAGQSVWVTVTTDETIKLMVTYNPEPVAVVVDKGWNMVAPTTPGGTKVSDIIETLGDAITEKDAIVIPASGNGGAPKIYNKVNGEWGYDDIEYEERTIKGQKVKVAKPFRNTADTTIKAGRGVWFVNGGDTEKNIDL